MMHRRPNRAAALVAAVSAVVVCAGAAQADLTVTGDPAAWGEVTAAYKKLASLPGFRMKIYWGAGAPTTVVEVVPPDSFHSTVQSDSGGMETVSVKGQSRFRITMPGAPAGWQCQGVPPIQLPRDPTRDVQGTVEVSRGPDTAVEGTPVHTYIYTIAVSTMGQGGTGKSTLYVGAQTGLPRRAVTSAAGGEVTADYYDYGAKIDITLPACGSARAGGIGG